MRWKKYFNEQSTKVAEPQKKIAPGLKEHGILHKVEAVTIVLYRIIVERRFISSLEHQKNRQEFCTRRADTEQLEFLIAHEATAPRSTSVWKRFL